MVRKQGLELITWTYDPLLSRNAHINISRLGAVCKTYLRSEYGDMQDGLNAGLPSDRFKVDWWLRSNRVKRRLSHPSRAGYTLDHHLAENAVLFEAVSARGNYPRPPKVDQIPKDKRRWHTIGEWKHARSSRLPSPGVTWLWISCILVRAVSTSWLQKIPQCMSWTLKRISEADSPRRFEIRS
jgi:hypothetical protein